MPVVINERTFKQAVWGRDSYALLFVLLLIDYVILSLVNSPRWGGLIRTVSLSTTVLFVVHTSGASRRMLRIAQAAVVLSVVGGVVEVSSDGSQEGSASYLILTILLVIAAVVILRRVLPKRTVDVETMFGVVDVYIILGLIFATLFIGIALASPSTRPFLAQPGNHPPSNYVYLSYVTLTTVGFGDLTPYSNLARSVVVLEALIGQIFLVTLVARLVALYSAESRSGGFRIVRKSRHEEELHMASAGEAGTVEPTEDPDPPSGGRSEGAPSEDLPGQPESP